MHITFYFLFFSFSSPFPSHLPPLGKNYVRIYTPDSLLSCVIRLISKFLNSFALAPLSIFLISFPSYFFLLHLLFYSYLLFLFLPFLLSFPFPSLSPSLSLSFPALLLHSSLIFFPSLKSLWFLPPLGGIIEEYTPLHLPSPLSLLFLSHTSFLPPLGENYIRIYTPDSLLSYIIRLIPKFLSSFALVPCPFFSFLFPTYFFSSFICFCTLIFFFLPFPFLFSSPSLSFFFTLLWFSSLPEEPLISSPPWEGNYRRIYTPGQMRRGGGEERKEKKVTGQTSRFFQYVHFLLRCPSMQQFSLNKLYKIVFKNSIVLLYRQ